MVCPDPCPRLTPPLAQALAPHGGIVMWRAFVYGNGVVGKEDRARQAADTFLALDGKFDQNVVIQVGAVHSTVVLVLTP